MRIRSLNYISSLLSLTLVLSGHMAYSQTVSVDSISQPVDSLMVKNDKKIDLADSLVVENKRKVKEDDSDSTKIIYPFISGLSVNVDYGKLLTYWTNFERKAELGLQLNIKGPFFVSGELGMGTLTPKNAYNNADYESKGSYYRFGIGYSLPLNQKSNLSLGVKYASASYEDAGIVRISSSSGLHADFESPFQRSGLSAQWYEIVFGSESSLKPRLYIGAYLRLRMIIKYDEQTPIDTYAIPGYGRTFDNSVPALNLYVRYELFKGK